MMIGGVTVLCDECGVIQLSVVAYNLKEKKIVGKFDNYIKPPANAVWSNHASKVHGIDPTDHRIASAMGLVDVWKRFVMFIEGHLDNGFKKGIIAAWGGQSCDREWLFRITKDTHHGVLFMPPMVPILHGSQKRGFPLR
jgi:inhibitor of KinA sporulation pathway (predicted exonuclease)